MEPNSVRRCERCGQPAVLVVNRWESRRLFGLLRTGHDARTDHRCQSCGASFFLIPYLRVRFVIGSLAGVQAVLLGALSLVGAVIALFTEGLAESLVLVGVGGVALGVGLPISSYLTGSQLRAWRNPVVPGAAMPELRLGPLEDHRVCTCGHPGHVVRVTARTINGLPTGTDTTYVCGTCGTEFDVPDAWGVVFAASGTSFFGTLLVLLARLRPFEDLSGSNITVLVVLALGALIMGVLAAVGLARRVRHPQI